MSKESDKWYRNNLSNSIYTTTYWDISIIHFIKHLAYTKKIHTKHLNPRKTSFAYIFFILRSPGTILVPTSIRPGRWCLWKMSGIAPRRMLEVTFKVVNLVFRYYMTSFDLICWKVACHILLVGEYRRFWSTCID